MDNIVDFVSASPLPNEPRLFTLNNNQITAIAIVLIIAIFALVFVALADDNGSKDRDRGHGTEPNKRSSRR